MKKFKDYSKLICFIKPHSVLFVVSVFFMLLTQLIEKIASVGAIIPFITILIAGNKINIPHNIDLPFSLNENLRHITDYVNSIDRLSLLGWLVIGIAVAFFFKEIFNCLHVVVCPLFNLFYFFGILNRIFKIST